MYNDFGLFRSFFKRNYFNLHSAKLNNLKKLSCLPHVSRFSNLEIWIFANNLNNLICSFFFVGKKNCSCCWLKNAGKCKNLNMIGNSRKHLQSSSITIQMLFHKISLPIILCCMSKQGVTVNGHKNGIWINWDLKVKIWAHF